MDADTVHSSFGEFMRAIGLPMHLANPGHRRLDGQESVGNWAITGRFLWSDRTSELRPTSHRYLYIYEEAPD